MEVSGFCVCKFFKVQFYVILHMNHGKTTFKKLVFGYEHKNHTSNLPTYRFGDVWNLWVECPYYLKPGLHSVRRTYATEMRKRIYASHARRGVYTPRVDLGAYTQTSTQYRLRTISGRWIYFICRVKACVYA